MTAEEAAERLGVKPATLYAYVSRGLVHRRRGPDGRSVFDPDEIEQLARRGRPRQAPAAAEPAIETAVTALGADRPYYRGRDALALAERYGVEEVAGWLWAGELDAAGVWRSAPAAVAAARSAQAALPPETLPLERLQVIVPALAATDPLRHHDDPPDVVAIGQRLIAGMVDSLPGADAGAGADSDVDSSPGLDSGAGADSGAAPIAARLWPKLTAAPPDPALVDALRAALVLLADHELAASTLAARLAASVRADPYAAVIAGLGTIAGALHGGVSLRAEAMLAEARDPGHARRVLAQRLRRRERIPGLGHAVYRNGDGRARLLLDRIRAAVPGHPRLPVVDALLDEARQRQLPQPNTDFALATLAEVAGMTSGAGEAIFAIARTTGWLAHAREEYARPPRRRSRAVYIGPARET